jgi:hypothetical protein
MGEKEGCGAKKKRNSFNLDKEMLNKILSGAH